MRFKDLKIGQSFDFINPNAIGQNSFFHRCVKVSARKYKTVSGEAMHGFAAYTVGSINAEVFNVGEEQ